MSQSDRTEMRWDAIKTTGQGGRLLLLETCGRLKYFEDIDSTYLCKQKDIHFRKTFYLKYQSLYGN